MQVRGCPQHHAEKNQERTLRRLLPVNSAEALTAAHDAATQRRASRPRGLRTWLLQRRRGDAQGQRDHDGDPEGRWGRCIKPPQLVRKRLVLLEPCVLRHDGGFVRFVFLLNAHNAQLRVDRNIAIMIFYPPLTHNCSSIEQLLQYQWYSEYTCTPARTRVLEYCNIAILQSRQ